MNGISVTFGPLGFVQKRDIGLRYVVMDILQPNVHRSHGDGKVLKAGKEVEEMMRGEGEFGGLDVMRGKPQ